MQSMQINNKPFYKHEVPANMTVKAAKEAWKQAQDEAREAKRQEREANKQYNAVYRRHFVACLGEACLTPEEIMEKIASAAYTINPRTGLPFNSFLVRVSYEQDFLEEVDGREIYKGEILSSPAFQMEVKKYYRKHDLSGVRFTFPQGKPILVMTVFLEPKEKVETKKEERKQVVTKKPGNAFAMLENDVEPDVDTAIVEEIVSAPKPLNLKGAWAKK